MTHNEAVISLLETCESLKETIEQLQEENAFLTDTIEKSNLGEVYSERRSLINAVKEANQIKSEYESKLFEINITLTDAKKKQSDIDAYIEIESEKKIADMKAEYEYNKNINDEAFIQYKIETDKQLQEREMYYKKKTKKYLTVTFISSVFAIICFVINFM